MLDKILGSKTRLAILRQLFVSERPVMRPRDLAVAAGLSKASMSSELHKLTEIGLVTVGRQQNASTFQANDTHPFFQPLCDLVFREFGYMAALQKAVAGSDILAAYVTGGMDKPLEPLQVSVVSGLAFREVSRRLTSAENVIGREIIVKILSRDEFPSRRKTSKWYPLKDFEVKKHDR